MPNQRTRRACPDFGRREGALTSIGRYAAVVAIVAMGMLGACAGPRHVAGPTAQEAAANRAQPYEDGLKALQTYQTSGECATTAASKVEAMMDELKTMTSNFHSIKMTSLEREARDRHTDLSFRYADAALHKNCLDQADQVYRDLIHFYVGGAYSGIRDRARVGIDDVRARR